MNPNKVNHFDSAGVGVNRKRSVFHRPSSHLTTMNSGELVPLYCDEILPGDNIKIKAKALARMATPIFPVMDNAFIDIYAFWVPNRLVFDKWKEFFGENNTDYWTENQEYSLPMIKFGGDTSTRNILTSDFTSDVLGYLGVPPTQSMDDGDVEVNAMPVRAYVKIWNDWFRNQNTRPPAHLYLDGETRLYNDDSDPTISAELGGRLLPVSKFNDYFTSALPGAQKGAPVQLPLGGFAPVSAKGQGFPSVQSNVQMTFAPAPYSTLNFQGGEYGIDKLIYGQVQGNKTLGINALNEPLKGAEEDYSFIPVAPSNLYADLSEVTAATVNQLRLAFQTQKYLETLARSGSRYVESLYSLYGVKASDRSLQRSEYLGGVRVPISMTSVAQTSATDNITPQGNLSAFSVTGLEKNLVDHFFEEHGYLLIVGCIRVSNKYSQGIEKMWSRKNRFDFYAPVFSNLGEMPIYNKEIYLTGNAEQDNGVFGYQEAWVEYKTKFSRVSGYMAPYISDGSLSAWHYGSNFDSLPYLVDGFTNENPDLVDRTLAVQRQDAHQFIVDFYVDNYSTRVMPMYSVPGLIDHA